MRISPRSRSTSATRCGSARSSASSARPADRPARICIMRPGSRAKRSTRRNSCARGCGSETRCRNAANLVHRIPGGGIDLPPRSGTRSIPTMKLHYYPETDSLYIELKSAPGIETREIVEGLVVDLDAKGDVVGFDIDHASRKLDLSKIETIALPPASAAE